MRCQWVPNKESHGDDDITSQKPQLRARNMQQCAPRSRRCNSLKLQSWERLRRWLRGCFLVAAAHMNARSHGQCGSTRCTMTRVNHRCLKVKEARVGSMQRNAGCIPKTTCHHAAVGGRTTDMQGLPFLACDISPCRSLLGDPRPVHWGVHN